MGQLGILEKQTVGVGWLVHIANLTDVVQLSVAAALTEDAVTKNSHAVTHKKL